ncbi:MAG TPA: vWA domain-containing protein [Planctomycetota bacterium]|jgi:hypothetical protein
MIPALLLAAAEPGPLTYWEWKLNRPCPAWTLALIVVAAAAFSLFFYFRQKGISFFQRLLWAVLRTLLFIALALLLFDPISISEHSVQIRKSIVVLCDASLSMGIKDVRRTGWAVAEAALAIGQVQYPNSTADTLLQRALQLLHRAGQELASKPVAARETQALIEGVLHDLSQSCPSEALPPLTTLISRQRQLQSEVGRASVPAAPTGRDARPTAESLATRQMEIAAALEQLAFKIRAPVKCDDIAKRGSQVTRMEIAKGILSHSQLKLLERLHERCDVFLYRFGEKLQRLNLEIPADGPETSRQILAGLKELQASDEGTALGTGIEEMLERHAGQPLAGIVLITDGGVNKGVDPVEIARRLGKSGTPIYTIGLGVAETQDVALRQMTAQEVAHAGDEMPVRAQIESTGYPGRQTEVIVKVGGQVLARQKVTLNGAVQIEELRIAPKDIGTFLLEVSVPPFDDESNRDNNALQQSLRVTDEKVKVLYVEGSPRWEYRYLRQVLLRDARLDVRFIMSEGDPELPKSSERYLAEFPKEAAEAYKYDMVILGDVNPEKLTTEQMERLEEMVRARGASFLMIAGHFYTPRAYAGTPIEKILPVELSGVGPASVPAGAGWMIVPPTLKLRLTPEGERSAIMRLDDDVAISQSIWSLVTPMYELPRLGALKTGATTLATVSVPLIGAGESNRTYPLIAWQRYGTGKSMYVGTDQLWRLRFKRGDRYHAKFWSQAIQVLTFSRLLGENKRINVETDQKDYQLGGRVQISVNAHNEVFEPLKTPQFAIEVVERGTGGVAPASVPAGKEPAAKTIMLQAVPASPGLYHGYYVPTSVGVVSFSAPGAAKKDSNILEVSVVNRPLELQQPEMQAALLQQMAAQSGGRFFAVRDLMALPDWLSGEELTGSVRTEKKLELPLFLLVLVCAGLEWALRRKNDLC